MSAKSRTKKSRPQATTAESTPETPRPVALVTGASSGIGREFAMLLAEKGHDLVIVARRASNLDIDVLINNAGYGLRGRFLDADWASHADFLQVMVTSWIHLTHLLVPAMVRRGHGRIVNVSSLASLGPEPPGSLYAPAKSLMTSASRSMRFELLGTGVHCTALCPGFTYSEFHDVLGCRTIMNTLPRLMWQHPRPVVEAGWKGVERNTPIVVPGWFNKTGAFACRMLPYAITRRLIPRAVLEENASRR
jgi:short-subunit dehydrogenase